MQGNNRFKKSFFKDSPFTDSPFTIHDDQKGNIPPPSDDFLIQTNGDFILQTNGDKILIHT